MGSYILITLQSCPIEIKEVRSLSERKYQYQAETIKIEES